MTEKQQILIVEDSEENVLFLSQILEDHGYEYRVATNGLEAIETLKSFRPDAVLLDILMPRKCGISVFKEMKKRPELEEVPVIVTTGASEVTGVDLRTGEVEPKETHGDEVARDIGSFLHSKFQDIHPDAFIEKPIDPDLLVAKLSELLS